MSPSFFNWTYVQRLIDKQLTNGWAIGIQANLVWYLTIISNSGRNKRLLRSLPCTSHSCNPRLHLQLNNITAPFGTTKALLLLHTPLGVLVYMYLHTDNNIFLHLRSANSEVWRVVILPGFQHVTACGPDGEVLSRLHSRTTAFGKQCKMSVSPNG